MVAGRLDLAVTGGGIYAVTLLVGIALLAFAGVFSAPLGILLSGGAALPAAMVIQSRIDWPAASGEAPRDMLRQHVRYGRWSFGSESVNWLIANGPLLLPAASIGLPASGVWRVIILLFMPLLQAAGAMTMILLRRLATADAASASAFWPAFRLLSAAATADAMLVVVAGPWLVPVLF
eukprot:gene9013-12179_t